MRFPYCYYNNNFFSLLQILSYNYIVRISIFILEAYAPVSYLEIHISICFGYFIIEEYVWSQMSYLFALWSLWLWRSDLWEVSLMEKILSFVYTAKEFRNFCAFLILEKARVYHCIYSILQQDTEMRSNCVSKIETSLVYLHEAILF